MNDELEDLKELDDFEISPASYEVWVIGYTRFDIPTTFEYLVGSFINPDAAVDRAKSFTLSSLPELDNEVSNKIAYFSIEVETVVIGSNAGTIYKRSLENKPLSVNVWIHETDYVLTDDGNIKIKTIKGDSFNIGSYLALSISEKPMIEPISVKVLTKDTTSITCEFVD